MKIWTLLIVLMSFGSTSFMEKSNSIEQNTLAASKLRALIIDGQNNHGVWPKTTMMMKDFLEQTNLFELIYIVPQDYIKAHITIR